MLYFINRTRPKLRYYGFDAGLSSLTCNMFRSHSFFGLTGQNFAKPRLGLCNEGKVVYDHPPHILFGQKAPLILPFLPETRDMFDDDVREVLVHTAPVTPKGVMLETGEPISLAAFAKLPRRKRDYFLKYGGCDVSRNWGSRAVWSLANVGHEECRRRLEEAAESLRMGSLWIMQPRVARRETVQFVGRDGETRTEVMTPKYGAFHGPSGVLGLYAQYRRFYKVHGQPDTVMTVAI